MSKESTTILEPVVDPGFITTPYIKELMEFSLNYLKADLPIHFSGPAGTGKSALAFHVAAALKRPIIMIHGDEEFRTSDLVGAESGMHRSRVRDEYIHSVKKLEEHISPSWVDNRLTVACKYGFTLIYDEFTRSRPEANNALLAVLEEKMLDLPPGAGEERYLKVHPNFRAIFTSNPAEYAGVYTAQDALRDRLVTIELNAFDEATEIAITQKRTGVSVEDAKSIVKIVRGYRDKMEGKAVVGVRDAIKIAKTLKGRHSHPDKKDQIFMRICQHILTSNHRMPGASVRTNKKGDLVSNLIRMHA